MDKCKIISHRGANKLAPMNTVPAFKKSLELGVDGFETDVHLSSDGKVVVCHNYTIDETSNGSGKISDMSFDKLREFDFGSYFSPDFKGTLIPSLEEFLDCCVFPEIEVVNVEIKSPQNKDYSIVDKTIDACKFKGVFDKLIISSFDQEVLIRAKNIDPNCKTALLYGLDSKISYTKMLFGYVKVAQELKCDYLHPYFLFVNKRMVARLKKIGVGVNSWTVDSTKTAKRLVDYGCTGIITNVPDAIKSVI